jgi:hypothetical protein
MSALPPKADIGGVLRDVRFVPEADLSRTFLKSRSSCFFNVMIGIIKAEQMSHFAPDIVVHLTPTDT